MQAKNFLKDGKGIFDKLWFKPVTGSVCVGGRENALNLLSLPQSYHTIMNLLSLCLVHSKCYIKVVLCVLLFVCQGHATEMRVERPKVFHEGKLCVGAGMLG